MDLPSGKNTTNLRACSQVCPTLAAHWLFQVLGPLGENTDETLPFESCRSSEDTQENMSSFQRGELRGNQKGGTLKIPFSRGPSGSQTGHPVWVSRAPHEALLSDLSLRIE